MLEIISLQPSSMLVTYVSGRFGENVYYWATFQKQLLNRAFQSYMKILLNFTATKSWYPAKPCEAKCYTCKWKCCNAMFCFSGGFFQL